MPFTEEQLKDIMKGAGGGFPEVESPFLGEPTEELVRRARGAKQDIREIETLMKRFAPEAEGAIPPEQVEPGFLSQLFNVLDFPGRQVRKLFTPEGESFTPTLQRALGGGEVSNVDIPLPFTPRPARRARTILGTEPAEPEPAPDLPPESVEEINKRAGTMVGNILGAGAGLAADIALDPLSYIGLGGPTKTGGRALVTFAPKGIFTAPGEARALIRGRSILGAAEKGVEAFKGTAAGRTLGKAFVPGFGLPAGYRQLDEQTKRSLIQAKISLDEVTDRMFADLNSSELHFASLAIENPRLLDLPQAALPLTTAKEGTLELLGKRINLNEIDIEKVQQAVEEFGRFQQGYVTRLMDSGLMDQEEAARLGLPQILAPGRPTPTERGTRLPRFRTMGRVQETKGFFAKEKEFDTLIDALNAGFLPETDIKKISRLFGRSVETVLAKKQFLDNTLQMFGTAVTTENVDQFAENLAAGTHKIFYPKGMVRFFPELRVPKSVLDQPGEIIELTRDQVKRGIGLATKGAPAFVVPKEIFEDLMKVNRVIGDEEATNAFLKFFDTAQTFWKGNVTVTTPGFHIRNSMGNAFNSWLGGMNNPNRFGQAVDVIQQASGRIGKYTNKEIFGLAVELGVYKPEGAFIGEITRVNPILEGAPTAGQLLNPFSSRFAPVEAGRAVGSAIENNARVAFFIDRLVKGDNPVEAARMVKKYLFDYGELTPFEQGVMKRVIPFYTWVRKNTALQAEHLLTAPGKYSATARLLGGPVNREELEERPKFLRRATTVRVPGVTIEGLPTLASIDLPISELELEQFGGGTARGFSPFIQGAISIASLIRGEKKAKVPIPEIAKQIAEALPEPLQKAVGVEDVKSFITGKPVPGMDPRAKSILLNALPLLGKLARLVPSEEQVSDPRFVGHVTGTFLGTRVEPIDPRKEKALTVLQRRRQLEEELNIQFREGKIDPLTFGFARRILRRAR